MPELPATENSPADILIVDDTPANLRLLAQLLTGQGYKVRPVTSGPRALVAAQASPPDLVLLDIKMPDMDGYQVCRQLKADPRLRDIPIIFISALDETEDKVEAFAAGAVDYIPKPFHVAEVLARIKTHLDLQRLRRQFQAANLELAEQIQELRQALDRIDTLTGLLPICASCKKIRDDRGYWQQVEAYIQSHSRAEFSHSICPDCARRLYPQFYDEPAPPTG